MGILNSSERRRKYRPGSHVTHASTFLARILEYNGVGGVSVIIFGIKIFLLSELGELG